MKCIIHNFTQNPVSFLRQCGYAFDRLSTIPDRQTNGEWSCICRITGYDYPRFHAYIHTEENDTLSVKSYTLIINLHLDQKKPSYGTAHAHSGDYDGEQVTKEAERIKLIYEQSKMQ